MNTSYSIKRTEPDEKNPIYVKNAKLTDLVEVLLAVPAGVGSLGGGRAAVAVEAAAPLPHVAVLRHRRRLLLLATAAVLGRPAAVVPVRLHCAAVVQVKVLVVGIILQKALVLKNSGLYLIIILLLVLLLYISHNLGTKNQNPLIVYQALLLFSIPADIQLTLPSSSWLFASAY